MLGRSKNGVMAMGQNSRAMIRVQLLLAAAFCLCLVSCDESSGNRQQPSGDSTKSGDSARDVSPTVDVERVGPGIVKLAWDANSETDLAGYRMHVGPSSRSYDREFDVGNKTTTEVDNLEAGKTYYFAVTAYNEANQESDYSNEVSYTEPES